MDLLGMIDELHAERRWLETLIAAGEVARRSPKPVAQRLLRELQAAERPGWCARLNHRKRLELLRMAERVLREACEAVPALPARSRVIAVASPRRHRRAA